MVFYQWRNFAWGCPWARDGWVPHWFRSACSKCKKKKKKKKNQSAQRANLVAWGPVGVQGQRSWWWSRGWSPRKLLCSFNAETAFSTQTYIRLLSLRHCLLQTKIRQYDSNTREGNTREGQKVLAIIVFLFKWVHYTKVTVPSFKLKFSLGFITSCYVIFSLSMVLAMDIFMIT